MSNRLQHPAQGLSTIAFATLLGLLPLVWPGFGNTSSDLLPKRIMLYVMASIISIIWLWFLKNRKHFSSPLALPATAYVLWNVLSLTWATNPFTGWIEAVQLIVLLGLFLAFIDLVTIQHIHTLARAVTVGGFAVSFIGIAQYLGLGFENILSVGLPSSTFIFRNLLAAYLLCAIPFALFAFLNEQKSIFALLWVASLCTMLLCLFYTRTRGAWIGIVSALCFLLFLVALYAPLRQLVIQNLFRHWIMPLTRWGTLACLILMVAGATRPAQTTTRVIQQFDEKKSTAAVAITTLLTPGSDRGRLTMWKYTLSMIADHPIQGVGIDNWEYQYPRYDPGEKITGASEPVRPHNDILWIASELGLIGLGLYIYLLFTAVRIGLVQLKKPERALTALIALTGLTALLVYSMFSFPKEQPTSALFLWIFLAMLSATNASPRNGSPIIPVLSIVICLCALYLATRNITFDIHYQRARAFEKIDRLPRAYAEITRALAAGSFDHRARFLKANYLQKMDRNPEAEKAYLHALNSHPNYAHSHHNLGGIYAAQKAFPQAIASYNKALALRPEYYQAQLHLGNAYAATEQRELAIEAFEEAIKSYPDFAQAHTNLGALYLHQNEYKRAIDAFRKAIHLQPSNAEAYNNLAYAYEQIGSLPDAITAYENLLKYWKGDPSYRETVSQHITDLLVKTRGN